MLAFALAVLLSLQAPQDPPPLAAEVVAFRAALTELGRLRDRGEIEVSRSGLTELVDSDRYVWVPKSRSDPATMQFD